MPLPESKTHLPKTLITLKPFNKTDKKTVVIGASENPGRYASIAINMLHKKGFEVVPVGLQKGSIFGFPILVNQPPVENVHTVTLYIRPEIQKTQYDYILSLHPKRIIFNPGTENRELEKLAQEKGIETLEACTLVMLSTGEY